MKQLLIILFCLLLFLGCVTTYGIKDNKEYVRMDELDLTTVEKLKLHWKTDLHDSLYIYDQRFECNYYLKGFDFRQVLK